MAKKIKIKTKISQLKKGDIFNKVVSGKRGKREFMFEGKVRMYDNWGEYKGFGYSYLDLEDVWGGDLQTFKDIKIVL